jgi:hypothetical protein
MPRRDVTPAPEEVSRFIHEVEAQFPDLEVLQREIDCWYYTF